MVSASIDSELSASENAYRAAVACWASYVTLERMKPYDESAELFIPGDLSDDSYAFTVVPVGFFTISSEEDS